jgi:hypothetical protein
VKSMPIWISEPVEAVLPVTTYSLAVVHYVDTDIGTQ